MHTTKETLYDLVKDLKTKQEFENELHQKAKTYDDLFDTNTLALLIVDELGRNHQSITSINTIQPNGEYTVIGKITNISDSHTFQRKNGKNGKVMNIDLADKTGSCRVVLWNDDIEQIHNKKIKPGTLVKIINGYTKQGRYGVEINLGRWGLLEPQNDEQKEEPIHAEENNTKDTIQGILTKKEPTRPFFKDTGDFGFVTSIYIKDKNHSEKKLILWDNKVKDIQQYNIGDIITIHGVQLKENKGTLEFHVNGKSSILKS